MLHIIQNDPEVPPGSITGYLNTPHLIHHPYCDSLLPKLADISALIVLGGSMGANDDRKHPFLTDLKSLIKAVVASGRSYLGICLGGQLLAAAMGARVESSRWEELGHYSATLTAQGANDRLFKGIANEFNVFQWHHDSFDLPPDAVLLASSAVCPHQAFRIGTSAWGVQFHPEVTADIIRCWCGWDKKQTALVDQYLSAFSASAAGYDEVVQALMTNFQEFAATHG